MAFDVFCKVDQIPGESTDDKHKDWIEVLSFSHGVSQPTSATASSAGGATTERCSHTDLVIVKAVDKASPKLFEACCKGTHLKSVDLEFCRSGGDKVKYLEVKMEQVVVAHVSPTGSSGGDFPSESVSFNYGKIKYTYTQQKRADGSGGGNVTGGWDLTANKAWA